MGLELKGLIEADRTLDAYGKHYLTYLEQVLKKPRMVVFGKDKVEAYDILGEKIPDLCGEYSDELKALIAAASDEKTQYQDYEPAGNDDN